MLQVRVTEVQDDQLNIESSLPSFTPSTIILDGRLYQLVPSQASSLPSQVNKKNFKLPKKKRKLSKKLPRTLSDELLHLNGTKKRLILAMVGLPGRGKTFLAKKLARYMNWLSYKTKVFNLGTYRRELYGTCVKNTFFDPKNVAYWKKRKIFVSKAMNDMTAFFTEEDGQVSIYDAQNTNEKMRQGVRDYVSLLKKKKMNVELVWIEVICNDPSIIEENISMIYSTSPDYQGKGITKDECSLDFKQRINFVQETYQPLGSDSEAESYIKTFNNARQIFTNRISGYILGKIVLFLGTCKSLKQDIFFSRHGESCYNVDGKLGGDSSLSPRGKKYAVRLSNFILNRPEIKKHRLHVWCSELVRTIETCQKIGISPTKWRTLSEIDAGICDGLTLEEVKQKYPNISKSRKSDKLRYRYPQGESYEDVIHRLEHVIFELNRLNDPILVVSHRAVLRCLFAYYQEIPWEKIPYVSVPLHTVVKLSPVAYGCKETKFSLGIESVDDAVIDDVMAKEESPH